MAREAYGSIGALARHIDEPGLVRLSERMLMPSRETAEKIERASLRWMGGATIRVEDWGK